MTALQAILEELGIPDTFLAGAIWTGGITLLLYWSQYLVYVLTMPGRSRRSRMHARLRKYRR